MTRLIDSHVHVWDPAVNHYDWLSGELARSYLPDEYRAGAPQATGAICVEAGAGDGLAEARWVASLLWPELLGFVAHAPLERGVAVADPLDRLQESGGVVGIRRMLQDQPLAFFDDPGLLAGLRVLATRGLPFDACVRHAQLPALTSLLAQVPDLPVVLDHLGKPPVAHGDDGTWARNVRALATLPQVRIKLSGIAPEGSADRAIREQARSWLVAAVEVFGPERCMLGSDWPVSAGGPSREAAGAWLEHVVSDVGASDSDRDWLMWRTASTFYGV
ncbi:MAG TPA: amidohydrolase family protein [Pseudolysinimonas sp.]|nr:amidohydrolase family protein [Pseudolysinimonas sp.]